MNKLLKLSISPFSPPMDEACGLNIQTHVPYGKDSVTLLINPSLTDYIEKDGNKDIKISQLTFNVHTKDTKIVELNFSDKNIQIINNGKNKISIRLMNIGSEKLQGQDFMFFEILVSEQE